VQAVRIGAGGLQGSTAPGSSTRNKAVSIAADNRATGERRSCASDPDTELSSETSVSIRSAMRFICKRKWSNRRPPGFQADAHRNYPKPAPSRFRRSHESDG
jgi:hypothetical protein